MTKSAETNLKDVSKLVNQLSEKLTEINTKLLGELSEVKEGINFLNTSFEEVKTSVASLTSDLRSVKGVVEELKTENGELRSELAALRNEVIDMKQYSRRNNVEIKGVSFHAGENVEKVVVSLARKVNVSLSSADFDALHRVPTKDREKQNIVVKFCSRETRDRFVLQAKKTKNLFDESSRERIFVNDHLCPERKILLGKAIQKKKSCHWKYVWVSESKILARKEDGSRVVQIRTEADLCKIA